MASSSTNNPARAGHGFTPVLLLLALVIPVAGCVTTPKSTSNKSFEKRFSGFRYSSVEAVRQSKQKSCGAAALTSILNYWKADAAPEFAEKDLIQKYPARSKDGYPIHQLREMAMQEQFAAFVVTLDSDPWKELGEHVDSGRPVICAVTLPRGRYFGSTIPLVETLDRQTVMSTGNEWKSHYVVAIGRSYNEILLMDPKYGIVKLGRDTFLFYWSLEKYAALICSSV